MYILHPKPYTLHASRGIDKQILAYRRKALYARLRRVALPVAMSDNVKSSF